MHFRSVPVVVAWVVAVAGAGLLAAALYWMRAPALRSRRRAGALGVAFVLLLVSEGARGDRSALVLSGVGLAVAGLPLLVMGRLPDDVPSRRYPTMADHRRYRQLYRRGLVVGVAMVVLEIAWIVAWVQLSR